MMDKRYKPIANFVWFIPQPRSSQLYRVGIGSTSAVMETTMFFFSRSDLWDVDALCGFFDIEVD